VEGIVVRRGKEVGRCGGYGEIVWVQLGMIRNWFEVLQRREMWCGCIMK